MTRLLLALLLAAGSTTAQSLIETRSGTTNVGHFGTSVDMSGDVDGDGLADLLMGAPGQAGGAGRIWLYRSSAGSYTQRGDTSFVGFYGAQVAFAGDVNGDGHEDILAASIGHYVRLLSGADLSLLHEHTGSNLFGFDVSAAGDVNADGYDDYIITDPGFDLHRGMMGVYNGRNHQLIFAGFGFQTDNGSNPGARFGHSAIGAGDIDRDGFDDVIVGSPTYDVLPGTNHGRVVVYSSRTWSVMFEHFGNAAGNRIGRVVAGVGDVNDDGFLDYAFTRGRETDTVRSVRVFSGTNGGNIANINNNGNEVSFGESLTGADINGDGFSDVVIGAPLSNAGGTESGRVWIVSLAGGQSTLHSYVGTPFARFGSSVSCGHRGAAVGPAIRDGNMDLAIGAPYGGAAGSPAQSGEVFVHEVGTLGGQWTPPRIFKIEEGSSTSISTKVKQGWFQSIRWLRPARFIARGVLPNSICVMTLGAPTLNGVGVPLTSPLAPGCAIWVDQNSGFFSSPLILANSHGIATWETPGPLPAALRGFDLQYSWTAFDPANNALGIATSNGGRMVIGGP